MEELKYPTENENVIETDSSSTANKIEGNIDLRNFGDLTTKTLNCMSINNPYGDIHTSSNINVNGELFVFEKATLQSDVELSSENFRTIVKGNLDASILNVDNTINSVKLNSNSLNTDTLIVSESSEMKDVTVNGNLMILGEIKYKNEGSCNKNIEIDPSSNLSGDSSTESHIVFGADNSLGSWRITIIKGSMHVQQHDGKEWITKTSFK